MLNAENLFPGAFISCETHIFALLFRIIFLPQIYILHRERETLFVLKREKETSFVLQRVGNIICIKERGKHHLYYRERETSFVLQRDGNIILLKRKRET